MNQARDESVNLSVACTQRPAHFAAMGDGLLPGRWDWARAKEPISGRFRWPLDPQADFLKQVAAVIDAEHRCCRFLRFVLIVEPGDGPLWLEVIGPEETEDFLSTLFDTTSARPSGK